jgi:putative transcriptional regulator
MADIKSIRAHLAVTQQALADAIGCTQGNVSNYEKGQTIPPDVAGRLIEFAKTKGAEITYDHVYGSAELIGQTAEAAQPGEGA